MTKSFQYWCYLSLISLFLITGCVNDGPSLLGSQTQSTLPSKLSLTDPGTLYQGGSYTFSGSCEPNGTTISISLPGSTPSQINNCTCSGGSFSCPSTTLSSIPASSFEIKAQNNRGDSSEITVSTVIPSVSLDDPGFISSGDNVTFTGSCSPDELDVDITLTTATPSTIDNCDCSGGTFSCPATVITGFSSPAVVARASNYSASTSDQRIFTLKTAFATAATPPTVYGLNMTMALDLTGPSSLPGDSISITSSCYTAGISCGFGDWDPPGTAVGSFSLLGFTFLTTGVFSDPSPAYLDLKGGTNRTLTINFGASAKSLDTTQSKYYFWIAMAGLGSSPEFVTVTSNRNLQVIGYQDAFSTGDYSFLNGAATNLGSTGTTITTKPASGANGYTFYLIQDRTASTIELSYVHGGTPDFHGFILGAIEIRNQ